MTKVSIVAATQPRIDGLQDGEELLAYIARVSNPANQLNTDTAPKLIKYLLRNHHWSPLEMVNIVVEVETTRDIARQILRHRSFSFQEFSQRYADPTKSLGFVTREARLQDSKNRQNSIELASDRYDLQVEWDHLQKELTIKAKETYDWAIANGIAKEQARSVLPEGLTASRLYMNGNLRSWVHYCELRRANGTQKEHAQVAELVWEVLRSEYPATVQAVEELATERTIVKNVVYVDGPVGATTTKRWWEFWKKR